MKSMLSAALLAAALVRAEPVDHIRDLYRSAGEDIESGALYTTEVRLNSGELPYPGSGIFSRTVTFYWSAEPWATPAHRLVKALVSWEVSAVTGDDEYLFDRDGGLVFCLRTGGLDELEQRFYYSDGRLIRFMDSADADDSPDPRLGEEPLNEGETLKQAFLLLH